MELRLPEEKVSELRVLIRQWKEKKSYTKWELLNFTSKLAHVAKSVKPGRTFLRRLINTVHSVAQLNHYVKLKAEFRLDLAWWACFLEMWSGRSGMEALNHTATPSGTIYTDASGLWGCRAFWTQAG